MQIHELQEYSGVPESGSFLAIDDGTNTRKIIPINLGIQTEMTQAEAESGTSTAKRILTPKVFHDSVLSIVNSSSQGRVWYGTCPTAASGTTSKIVTVEDGFELVTGATIAVKFTNAAIDSLGYERNLNVNGTGAVNVSVSGMTTFRYNPWSAGDVVVFVYDGIYWQMVSPVTAKKTDITSQVSVSRTGGVTGSTVSVTSAYRTGNVVTAGIRIDAGSAVSAGSNVITFSLNINGSWTGAANVPTYYGSTLMVAGKSAGTNPTVTVRAISALAAAAYSTINMIFPIED